MKHSFYVVQLLKSVFMTIFHSYIVTGCPLVNIVLFFMMWLPLKGLTLKTDLTHYQVHSKDKCMCVCMCVCGVCGVWCVWCVVCVCACACGVWCVVCVCACVCVCVCGVCVCVRVVCACVCVVWCGVCVCVCVCVCGVCVRVCVCERESIPSTVLPLTESPVIYSTEFRTHPLGCNGKSCVKETHGEICPVHPHMLHNVCLRGKSSEYSVTSQTQPDAHRKASWEDASAQHPSTQALRESERVFFSEIIGLVPMREWGTSCRFNQFRPDLLLLQYYNIILWKFKTVRNKLCKTPQVKRVKNIK